MTNWMRSYVSKQQILRQPQQDIAQPQRVISSYMLNDNIIELKAMQENYARQQATKAQFFARFEKLDTQCFGKIKIP